MGRALQLLAVLILMFAPALDSAAFSAERGNAPAQAAQMLPAWLDVVEDPLDHPAGQPPGSHCNQIQLSNFLPAAEQILSLPSTVSPLWDTRHKVAIMQTCTPNPDRPPQA